MLGRLDIIIILGYFVFIILIGLYFSGHHHSSGQYFLAGRSAGWIAVGASLFASNISSEHFIGLAGSGAMSGMAVGHFEWIASIIVLLLAYVFVPYYIKTGIFTMPEFLERRYGRSARIYLSIISVVAYITTKISITLYAGGLLLSRLIGVNMMTAAVIMIIASGLYTISGGLKAVIYTELIQMFVLIGGAITLTLFGLKAVGGIVALQQQVPTEFFSMFKPASDPAFPWTGIIFGAPIIAVWYWCTDQFIVQRVLAAKDIKTAQRGAIFAGYIKILPVFIFVVPGIIAAALFPGVRGDDAFPMLVTSWVLPIGFRGVVIAGLLAAVMSSLSSCFNSVSTLVTMDLYTQFRRNAGERELVLVGRLITTAVVMIGILWVPLIQNVSSHIFIYLQSVQAFIAPPIASVFLIGITWKGADELGALVTLIVGGFIGGLRLLLEIIRVPEFLTAPSFNWFHTMNYLHFAVFLFLLSTVLLIVFSRGNHRDVSSVGRLLLNGNAGSGIIRDNLDKYNITASIILVIIIFSLMVKFF